MVLTRREVRGLGAAPAFLGLVLTGFAFVVFLAVGQHVASERPDFFYLADAFLHGRTWLEQAIGQVDVISIDGRVYIPFAPFPAFALVPLVAAVGPVVAASWEPIVNAGLAAASVGLCWALLGRLGVADSRARFWLAVLFGFSTAILWVTTRGGVWHTGQLFATVLTLLALLESFGRRRPLVLGLLAGAAFLCRAPLILALPFYAWAILPRSDDPGWRGGRHPSPVGRWVVLALAFAPALAGALWYNAVRFGSPLESGYALATLPVFLEAQREKGLFSLAHLPMNLDYFLLHVPRLEATFPFLRPDGFGMSVLITSPGLLGAFLADWRDRRSWALAVTAAIVLVPSLLYYGGGWLQYGYRYFLDSLPFVIALCGLAAARRGVGWIWKLLIAVGLLVNLIGIYWAYNLG
jgi:hypothetical protein